MSIFKQAKDFAIKSLLGSSAVPGGLFELSEYFRRYGPIEFSHNSEPEQLVAVSKNFRFGTIVTSGTDEAELDANIKDAILTSFEVPSAYAHEARICKLDGKRDKSHQYALA